MTQTQTVTAPPPRADAPRLEVVDEGLFPFARTGLRGLPLPFWTLQAYLFFLCSRVDEHWDTYFERFRPRLAFGMLTLVLLGGVLIKTPGSVRKLFQPIPARWWLALCIALAFSTLWAFDFGRAVDAAISHGTSMMGFVLLVLVIDTRRKLLLTLLNLCMASGLFLLLSLHEWRGGRYDYTMGVIRMMGAGKAYADPNSFGATLAFMFPLVAWTGIQTRSWLVRLGAAAFGGLGLVSVFYTSSRSALMLASLTGICVFFLLPSTRARIFYLLGGVALAAIMASGLSENQVKRIASIFSTQTYSKDESTHGRVKGYGVAAQILADRPVLGVGPGNWSEYRRRRVDGDPLMPHNLVGQLAATRGAVGFVVFFGFLISTWMLALRTWRQGRRSELPFTRAMAQLSFVVLFTYFLMLVSGLGAHNLSRPNWFWLSALALVAARLPDGLAREPYEEAFA